MPGGCLWPPSSSAKLWEGSLSAGLGGSRWCGPHPDLRLLTAARSGSGARRFDRASVGCCRSRRPGGGARSGALAPAARGRRLSGQDLPVPGGRLGRAPAPRALRDRDRREGQGGLHLRGRQLYCPDPRRQGRPAGGSRRISGYQRQDSCPTRSGGKAPRIPSKEAQRHRAGRLSRPHRDGSCRISGGTEIGWSDCRQQRAACHRLCRAADTSGLCRRPTGVA